MSYLAILLRALTYEMLSCSWFYKFRLFMFLVLQIPAFHVPGFTDSGFSCSWFYRFRLFMFLVLQIPAFHVPGSLVPRSVPCSVPRSLFYTYNSGSSSYVAVFHSSPAQQGFYNKLNSYHWGAGGGVNTELINSEFVFSCT